jgi:MEMO1 family protein
MFPSRSNAVRLPAVAGRFYPDDPPELRRVIEALLLNAPTQAGSSPKAIIAPHAGYIYSGPIAASAYAWLRPDRHQIKRIVLLGPSHFVALKGLAASSAKVFATPLGGIPVDVDAVQELARLPQVQLLDEAHAREHSLEVHLPFLQIALEEFKLVPLVAGEATPDEVAQVLEHVWGGPETRFVISSDLSHYLDSDSARQLDCAAAEAIERLAPDKLDAAQACGCVPIRGMLQAALNHGLRAKTVDLRNSGDTAGPRDQVVGYGAFVFCPAAGP